MDSQKEQIEIQANRIATLEFIVDKLKKQNVELNERSYQREILIDDMKTKQKILMDKYQSLYTYWVKYRHFNLTIKKKYIVQLEDTINAMTGKLNIDVYKSKYNACAEIKTDNTIAEKNDWELFEVPRLRDIDDYYAVAYNDKITYDTTPSAMAEAMKKDFNCNSSEMSGAR
jgi:hypothetical protein